MQRRRTLPSSVKWRPTQPSDDRCLRCGSWPDQRLHPAAPTNGNHRWHTKIYDDQGRQHDLTLCPTCASRLPADLLLEGGWRTLRRWWPVRGRRVPEVTLGEIHTLDIDTGPAMIAAAKGLWGNEHRLRALVRGASVKHELRREAGDLDSIPGLAEVLEALDSVGPWTQLAFLVRPQRGLGGGRPVDLLREGRLDEVLRAARQFGEQGAI